MGLSNQNEDRRKLEMARRLIEAREGAGFRKRVDAVRHFRWNPNTYKGHEYGTRSFDEADAAKYAVAYNVAVEHLLALDHYATQSRRTWVPDLIIRRADGSVSIIEIKTSAKKGVWMESDENPFPEGDILIPAVPRWPASDQYARKAVDEIQSVAEGSYVIFLPAERYPELLKAGALVDVVRERSGLVEHTIKGLEEIASLGAEDPSTGRVIGVAVGAYKPLM